MRFRSRQRREEPEINLIPLIDVLLVILIFLMITTTYSRFSELQIQLPTADAERTRQRPPRSWSRFPRAGVYAVNKEIAGSRMSPAWPTTCAVRPARTTAASRRWWSSTPMRRPPQAVINVLEAARLAGLPRLTFATQSQQPR